MMKLPYYLFSSFNRKSLVSFKKLKKKEDRSYDYIFGINGYYNFQTKSKYHMIRGFIEWVKNDVIDVVM